MSKRIVVFVSGGGSNLQALIDATQSEEIDGEIVLVVSNKKAAYGLVRAETSRIPTVYASRKPFHQQFGAEWREKYDAHLVEQIAPYSPDVIVLAGWMHINTAVFLNAFPRKVINLHPALPGWFPGAHAIDETWAAFQAGEIEHGGCMVHYAIPEVDAGEPIVTAIVPLKQSDTRSDFEHRLHATEHRIIVLATQIMLFN